MMETQFKKLWWTLKFVFHTPATTPFVENDHAHKTSKKYLQQCCVPNCREITNNIGSRECSYFFVYLYYLLCLEDLTFIMKGGGGRVESRGSTKNLWGP